MKRGILLLMIICIFVLFVSCQPTPEKSAVQSKNKGEFEKALSEEPQEVEINAEKTVKDKYNAKDSAVTIDINAKVTIPNGIEKIQVPEVVAYRFDDEFVKKMVDACMEGETVYDYPKGYSKDLISERMKQLEVYMTDDYLNQTGYTDAEKEEIIALYKEQYKILLNAYKTATDESYKKKSDLKLKPYKYYLSDAEYKLLETEHKGSKDELEFLRTDEATDFKGRAYKADGYVYELYIEQTPKDFSQKCAIAIFAKSKYYYTNFYQCKEIVHVSDYGSSNTGGETVSCNLLESEAMNIAKQFLTKMGFDDQMTVTNCSKEANGFGQEYFSISCRRSVSNITIADLPMGGTDDEYRPRYGEESLYLSVTDDGVMECAYMYPLKIQRIVNKGVGIKTFDEIIDIYKKQSALTYDTIYDVTAEDNGEKESVLKSDSAKVSIDSIDFKLMRIAEKDKSLTYLLAPVWTFSGEITYFTSDNEALMSNKTSIMINAVDGSIINAADCY